MGRSDDSAATNILKLLREGPDLEWQVSELIKHFNNRWNRANVDNSLLRLHKNGSVKKKKEGTHVWFSAVAGQVAPVAAEKPAKAQKAGKPAEPVAVSKPVEALVGEPTKAPAPPSAADAVVALLAKWPNYEMSVADIFEELARKYPRKRMEKAIDRVVAKGLVLKVKDAGRVFYSIGP